MPGNTAAAAVLRRRLAAWLYSEGYVSDPRIRAAFAAVPRHWFLRRFYVPAASSFNPVTFDPRRPDLGLLRTIYTNQALVTRFEEGCPVSSSSEPAVMAVMLEALAVRPGDRVLEVGAGTGYNAALLGTLAGPEGQVISLDISDPVVEEARAALETGGFPQVKVHLADGRRGWPPEAPYDRIIVTAASRLHRAWTDQLRDGGRLVLPFALEPGSAPILWLQRSGRRLHGKFSLYAHFMPLQGEGEATALYRSPPHPLAPLTRRAPVEARMSELWDIALFLALEAPASFAWGAAPSGLRVPALRAPSGVAAWSPAGLLTAGPAPPLQTLEYLLLRWHRLGRPALGDYAAEAWVEDSPPSPPRGAWLLAGTPSLWIYLP